MRNWLITGCSSGFGAELARAALAAGDRVMATARDPERLTEFPDRTRLDVTDESSITAAVAQTLDRFGAIDVLVNNAGHGSVGAVEEIEPEHLRALMDVMFFGAVSLTRAVLPHMRARQPGDPGSVGTDAAGRARRGTIVQISSMGGQLTMPAFGAYCAAKFALEAISEALYAEVAALGIRVHIIEPGAFRTGFGGARLHRSPRLPAYAETTAATRAAVESMDGSQPGDPAKAAQAILTLLDAPDAPLRLALGSDAVDAIRAHHTWLQDELAKWESLSRSC
ncbi:SDR family NAD(P)-dependent oxidoreductase [Dactylosporangium matsuzakiense]|uniref:Short-chain dehydrogenase/reductase n=1 Tax=Dactylosporangium matsuzakiense TaxID=53360 RepID=A0A9W6NN39_9ACTN|nr:SDR family NAD(P)-dependent oxidoreductase [Dactylosporangium matsuzakiense]UWZ43287.1 SDR family NAD(P)-dependent oxidoreductase [Dactylosporangium matsuzakiense]GLL02607.1 short-chain dehydrogenase/reductase [Dactylosporangium matsuzakiense]